MSPYTQFFGRGLRTAPTAWTGRKYRPGSVLTTFAQIVDAAERGVWIFHGDRPYHPSWVMSWQLWMVSRLLDGGHLRLAIRNKAVPLVFRATWMHSHAPDIDSCWWVTCDEIPRWQKETNKEHMAIALCQAEAKARGHFGQVEVKFLKDLPTTP